MKIAVISDLHGILPPLELEGVELLLICGDISPLEIQRNIPEMMTWLINTFKPWAENLPVEKVVFIAGNHDFICESKPNFMFKVFPQYEKVTYLCNTYYAHISSQDFDWYEIYGTPYCKEFGNWPFMRVPETLIEKFNEIPRHLDILLTHDAPRIAELGCIKQEGFQWYGTEAGNQELANAVLAKKPRYCFCGHIHSGQHELQEVEGIKMANTSLLNEHYQLVYKPLILDITK